MQRIQYKHPAECDHFAAPDTLRPNQICPPGDLPSFTLFGKIQTRYTNADDIQTRTAPNHDDKYFPAYAHCLERPLGFYWAIAPCPILITEGTQRHRYPIRCTSRRLTDPHTLENPQDPSYLPLYPPARSLSPPALKNLQATLLQSPFSTPSLRPELLMTIEDDDAKVVSYKAFHEGQLGSRGSRVAGVRTRGKTGKKGRMRNASHTCIYPGS
ncbi:hypothetical protein FB446DRAFT_792373 [Lentinula raphanica]|nr:hypothetical protein FB446DRAFT_792373 [Lentinula raphanica]